MRIILNLLKNDEVCKYGDDFIFIAKGKYELVDTWKEKWKKIKFIIKMNLVNRKSDRTYKKNERLIKKLSKKQSK